MTVDQPVPLCSAGDLQKGAFADLVRQFSLSTLNDILVEATRACETEVTRRFAPFTITESHRAEGVDPDELGGLSSGIPLDLPATLGTSYAAALGTGSNLVRRAWLNEFAPLYPDMWVYSNVTVVATLSIGGTNPVNVMRGPQNDTGQIWFHIGTYLPIGSLIECTYSGGYQTMPADLRRAGKYMAAAICARELDPLGQVHNHSPAELESLAVAWLSPYQRT